MSPRTGRPKKEDSKKIRFGFRLNEETAKDLDYCAEKLNKTKTEVVEEGINLVKEKIK